MTDLVLSSKAIVHMSPVCLKNQDVSYVFK